MRRGAREQVDWSLLEAVAFASETGSLDDSQVAEPLVCGLQIALATLWRWLGVKPQAVLGQGTGAVAAAYVAGRRSLKEAMQIAVQRGRLRQAAGSEVAVEMSTAEGLERSLLVRRADVVFFAPWTSRRPS